MTPQNPPPAVPPLPPPVPDSWGAVPPAPQEPSRRGPGAGLNWIVGVLTVAAAALLGASIFYSYNTVMLAREAQAAALEESTASVAPLEEAVPEVEVEEEAAPAPVIHGAIYEREAVVFPGNVPGCPGTTELLAWGQLDEGGWFLVCGYSLEEPSEAVMEPPSEVSISRATESQGSDSGIVSTSVVQYDPRIDGYRASFAGGEQVWLSSVNGVVGVTDGSGNLIDQWQLARYYFVNLTPEKDAEREGLYEVDSPEETAQGQVEYLSELIAKSEKARTELSSAFDNLLECDLSTIDEDIAIIEGVRDNREELVAAVSAAPVDQIPGGVVLVSELVSALEASYSADVAYLDWAMSLTPGNCDYSGLELGDAYSSDAQVFKKAFSKNWNDNIADTYGVPTVSNDTL